MGSCSGGNKGGGAAASGGGATPEKIKANIDNLTSEYNSISKQIDVIFREQKINSSSFSAGFQDPDTLTETQKKAVNKTDELEIKGRKIAKKIEGLQENLRKETGEQYGSFFLNISQVREVGDTLRTWKKRYEARQEEWGYKKR